LQVEPSAKAAWVREWIAIVELIVEDEDPLQSCIGTSACGRVVLLGAKTEPATRCQR
jgi:hypothetical protein